MIHTTDAGAPWHETIAAYRARGGRPVDHPAADHLAEVVGRMRWIDGERELAQARRQLDELEPTTDRRVESITRWTVELLSDSALADWFLDGLPEEVQQREEAATLDAWDRLHRPWAAEVVLVREPYRCAISGRTDGTVALRLTSRIDDDGETLLLHVAEVMGTCQRGLARVEEGLDLVERMGPGET